VILRGSLNSPEESDLKRLKPEGFDLSEHAVQHRLVWEGTSQ
jgi:hypothetical protein